MDHDLIEIVQSAMGQMLVLKTDTVIGEKIRATGDYGAEEKALLSTLIRADQTIVDVGANIGSHTLFFSREVGNNGKVYSFEAQRFLFQILCGNVALNSLRNVWCIPAALGSEQGRVDVPVPDYSRDNNYGGYSLSFDTFKESGYMLTLDTIPLEACDLIKIDVEGMELEVFRGSRKTIDTFQPLLYLENNRPEKEQELLGHIDKSLGYDIFKHRQNVICCHRSAGTVPNEIAALTRLN